MSDQDAAAKYQFGPLERRGVGGMLRTGQVAVLVTAAVFTVGIVRFMPSLVGAFLAVGVVVVGFVVGFVPVSGRTLEQWAPPWARYHWSVCTGRHLEEGLGQALGVLRSDGSLPCVPPAPVAGVEILSFVHEGRRIGVAKDTQRGGYTVAMRTEGGTFMLRDPAEQEAMLARWGEFLATLTLDGSPITRLQVIERTVPDGGHDLTDYFEEVRDPALADDSPLLDSYRQLLDSSAPASQRHEVLLVARIEGGVGRGLLASVGPLKVMGLVVALVVSAGLAVVSIPAAVVAGFGVVAAAALAIGRAITSDQAEDRLACEAIGRELTGLEMALDGAELTVTEVLGPRGYAWAMRTTYDPDVEAARRPAEEDAGVSPANAWPLATTTEWSSYQTDSGLHRTWRVREFPRRPVHPDWLHPLLLETTARRAVSFVFEPVPASKAMREAEHAVTSDEAAAGASAEAGFRQTARKHRQARSAAAREEELTEGHGDFRYAAYITVSVPAGDEEALAAASKEVVRQAARSLMDVTPEFGTQAESLTYALPLCRGL